MKNQPWFLQLRKSLFPLLQKRFERKKVDGFWSGLECCIYGGDEKLALLSCLEIVKRKFWIAMVWGFVFLILTSQYGHDTHQSINWNLEGYPLTWDLLVGLEVHTSTRGPWGILVRNYINLILLSLLGVLPSLKFSNISQPHSSCTFYYKP